MGRRVSRQPGQTAGPDNLLYFYSSDSGNSNNYPKLSVTYSEPTPPAGSQAGDRPYFTYDDQKLTDKLDAKVNVGNGNLLVTDQDVDVAGTAGLDMAFERTYNSVLASTTSADTSHLGDGWSDNLGGSVRLEFPDNDGQRVMFYGPSGYRVRFERNAAGDYIRYAPGLQGTMSWDSGSQTLQVKMFNKTTYAFSAYLAGASRGQLQWIKNKNGNQLTFSYNSDGTLDHVTDTHGRIGKLSYDAAGMLSTFEVREPDGTPLIRWTYTYTGTTPNRLASSQLTYINATALPDTSDSVNLNAATTYGYDSNGRLSQIKDPRETTMTTQGGTTTFGYTNGQLTQLSRKTDDSSIPDSTSTYAYTTDLGTSNQCQGVGNATHRTTVDGPRLSTDVQDTTTYCMDKYDRVLQTVDANGHQRRATWTDNSNVETFDASGLAAGSQATYTYKYDSNDNPTDETAPNGAHASASFNDGANPNFPTSMYGFDIAGDKSSPATWAYAYDSDGNLTKARSDNSGNPVEYDYCWTNDGQLQRVDPLPIDTSTAGACTTAAQANDTLYTYNADHELQKVDPPGPNRTVTYTYDALSRVQTETDGRGVKTTYTYDGLDHVTSETFDGSTATGVSGSTTAAVTWSHDADGNITQITDPTTLSPTTYSYDELNRVTQESQVAPSSVKTFSYDPAGNLTKSQVSDEQGSLNYGYNAVNLMTSLTNTNLATGTQTVTFDYDRHDKRIKTVYPMVGGNNLIERAKYDDSGNMQCIYSYRANNPPFTDNQSDPACPSASATGLVTFEGYNDNKQVGALTIPTNRPYTMTLKGGETTSYTYDPISRLTGATTKSADTPSSTLRAFNYTYDAYSNITSKSVSGTTPGLQTGTATMAYTDDNELCWSYQGSSGNGCSSAPSGATTYTFNQDGAQTADQTGGSTGATLASNVIGQTSSIDPAGAVGPLPMSYTGVTQDMRTSKDTLNMSYGYHGLYSQSTNSGVPHETIFVTDPAGQIVETVDGNAAPLYYLTNINGSVTATMDANGASARRYLYEPYGRQIRTWIDTTPASNSTGQHNPPDGSETTPADTGADANPFRFEGGYYDTETGMLKFGARYYQTTLARWTQADPMQVEVSHPLSNNAYTFAGSNPIANTDPNGMFNGWGFALGAFDTLSGLGTIGLGLTMGALVGWTGLGLVGAFVTMGLGAVETSTGIAEMTYAASE